MASMGLLKRKPDSPPSGDLDTDSLDDKKKKPLTNERREERNMREKERSLKITQQIHELRNLLSLGGVIVPKVSSLMFLPNRIYQTQMNVS